MKNKRNTIRFVWPLTVWSLLLCIASSCDNFVDVDEPNSQLTSDAVFESNTTATAAMKNIYAKMRDAGLLTGKPLGLTNLLGQYSDELVCYETGAYTAEPFYNNGLTATNGYVLELWTTTYNQIYAANAVIKGVTNSTALTTAQKNQLIGEALFVRALLHSYLVGVYGGCPYITTTDYQQNSTVNRLSITAVYEKCIIDLEEASTLLPESYVSYERIRPNQFAAMALLARLYLYTEQWAEASNAASAVLNQTGVYVWEADLDKVFLKDCSSTIWQFSAGGGYANAQEGALFIFTAGPPPSVALSPNLYNSFEVGDQRRTHWINSITDGTTTWYHAYKYKQDNGSSATSEYSVMLRLVEQYLIRAEARARQGDLIGAKEDLNFIRNNAGLGNTTAVTGSEIVDAVLHERRFELFTETGFRFFDLQRTGKLDATLSTVKPGWNSTDQYWPVPQSELLINPNLAPQNAGY
ncbi:RagB/SusD family nutrient uptake outer membrane protein [Flavobacterium terrisoli]|uniref:RagB/SusD family nutrient uptake outer membrane protein n=1 Tax=Flavobacterium terrisoli TaxID=3242195 RepID=UPI002543DE83|nr:RagB/SusD family nutrient uptake outer membrane protein [Flavobacterium buctense]